MAISRQTSTQKSVALGSQRNYNEVIEFLDKHWVKQHTDPKLTAITALDKAFNSPSKNLKIVLVGGTNGKGLTIHFVTKLLAKEKISVGSLYSPHILSYNERITINDELISNKAFTEIANEVINTAESQGIKATSFEVLLMMSFLHFSRNNIDIVCLEMLEDSPMDPTNICHPVVYAITRITDEKMTPQSKETLIAIKKMLEAVKPGSFVVSGDQSKLNLQIMCDTIEQKGAHWVMPIRKLVSLPYPFVQLHGRCAALAERICQTLVDTALKDSVLLSNSLLAKQEGRRGRPTLEAKRDSERNPKETLEQFWQSQSSTLPGRFQLLIEKPSILLDNTCNIDALKNLLLGVRLLHYQRPLKGLTFIFGCDKNNMDPSEFFRLLRYFTKKNSAQVFFCPIQESIIPGTFEESWDAEKITNDINQNLQIKRKNFVKPAKNFAEAFEAAKKTVDERNGLVVIAGSNSIIAEYWHYKGIKKITPAQST